MLDVPDYDLDHPAIITADEVCSPGEQTWFRRQLKRIAGKNRFGGLNLELRWGVTYVDPMAYDPDTIKYLDFTRHGRQYGERRWVIEIWRSPEFLERSGRYKIIHDSDTVTEFYFCTACGTEIKASPATLQLLGDVPPCLSCGSRRHRTELIRETGKGQLLQEFPAEGCYDFWLRLERADYSYHAPDAEAVKAVEAIWQFELLPQNQRNLLAQADAQLERRKAIQMMRQQTPTTVHFGSGPMTLAEAQRIGLAR